jgi:streptogramin lyase
MKWMRTGRNVRRMTAGPWCPGIAVDKQDNVWLHARITVQYAPDGRYLWMARRPAGRSISSVDREDNVWMADVGLRRAQTFRAANRCRSARK